ncbi:hypothetical protein FisN_35Lu024 [Fistulifera solaris]|uniref:Endonuclease/exonuclease/phosphatase domain-containing protein n=1 Tax=Fistulifera solaris TaxID=1519565 RepID=A0A1Z5KRT4_FISSO|nr:hypothetical protein FisN_35Lu024 [Fistulifera solaris]|eukprot:GAX28812.1 hypothetical protein FisN_35Lu024 [Fistulifera solaris]
MLVDLFGFLLLAREASDGQTPKNVFLNKFSRFVVRTTLPYFVGTWKRVWVRENTALPYFLGENTTRPYFPATALASSSSQSVGIVTWNLLAPQYAVAPKYPFRDHLDWSYRQALIIDILQQCPTNDIICLQEVQVDKGEDLQAAFQDTQMTILQQVPHHPVACAILVRNTHWTVLHTESRSRALLCILEHRTSGQSCARNQSAPLIITGDFNLWEAAAHPIYQILATGRIPQALPWDPQKIWLEAPSWAQNLLPLTDTQASQQQPTFARSSILDYIWVLPDLRVEDRWRYGNVLRRGDGTYPPQPWPNKQVPSDHIPVGVLLKWNG